MLMLSSRRLGPCESSFLISEKKLGEIKILKIFKMFVFLSKNVMLLFFGQYTIAISALKFWKRQIVNNLTHNLRHSL